MINLGHIYASKASSDDTARTITCWASRGDIVDRDGEVVLPEAFRHPDSLSEYLGHPVIIVGHDYKGLAVGRAEAVEAVAKGLRLKVRFLDTPSGREAYEICRDGAGDLGTFSIGFQGLESEYRSVDELKRAGVDTRLATSSKVRCWTHVKLYEVSLVAVPSCPTATVISRAFAEGRVKSADLRRALDQVIHITDPKPMTPRELRAEIAKLAAGYGVAAAKLAKVERLVKARLEAKAKEAAPEKPFDLAAYVKSPEFRRDVEERVKIAHARAIGKVW